MAASKKTQYYRSFEDDFVESTDQDFELPEDYVWVRKGVKDRIAAVAVYAVIYLIGLFHGRFVLHLKIRKNVKWKDFRGVGAVVYGNHTQPIGDVYIPAMVCGFRRCYTIVSPANLKVPVIGPMLPWLGALPIPGNISKMGDFLEAVKVRLQGNHSLIVYPEGHVWPYCTQIRPFPATSFDYAVKNKVPAFCMTTTYQSRRFSDRPRTTVYLDGPFYPDENLTKPARKKQLRDQVYECMQKRSQESTYEYIRYRPMEENPEKSGQQ